MAKAPARSDRAAATREVILATAERLMAEHGVYAVSNRQISEAAGQGNTAAVGYHFGTKQDLVRAVVARHSAEIERIRAGMIAAAAGSTELRDWVACLVAPPCEHLAELGNPTWFARFGAQLLTDPALRAIMAEESQSPALLVAVDRLRDCLPELPAEVASERGEMVRHLIVTVPAERERALAEGAPTARRTWRDTATGLVDAVTGIWRAPFTPTG